MHFYWFCSRVGTGTCMHGKMPWAGSLLPNWKLHAHKINLQKGQSESWQWPTAVCAPGQDCLALPAFVVCWVLHNFCLAASQTLCGSVDRSAAVRNSHINLMRQQAKQCQREKERGKKRERGSMCVSELMPDNKQNIKTALSARRIMQADPSTTSKSQSMLATPSPLPPSGRVTLYNPYKIS